MMQSIAQATIRVIPAQSLQAKVIPIGTTTELAIFPPDANFEARNFLCRLSTASLDRGGPFSDFSGYNRILALVSGGGVHLTIDGNVRSLTRPFGAIEFRGDVPVQSELVDGPITDFNIIYRPGVSASLRPFKLRDVFSPLPSGILGSVENATRVSVVWSPDADLEIEAGRQRVSVDRRGVYILQHARNETTIQARTKQAQGNALLATLWMPAK